MTKAYIFLRKTVALALNVLVFYLLSKLDIPYYLSIPPLILTFSFIVSRITTKKPKELYNHKRSEKYFNKGGLRDLIRIPVVFFAFWQDLIVWFIWGVYQVFIVFTDALYFLKEVLFYILHAFIWLLKQLLPFWRILLRIIIFYCFKWPWWIYRYSFRMIRKTFNWNILKVSFTGTIVTLLVVQTFYFLEVTLEIENLVYIGIILALMPLAWIFGEISSIRGQNLLFIEFSEVKKQYRNGIETVRGLLVLITLFVVLILAEAFISFLGWLPKTGIMLLGLTINISFIINIIILLLVVIITFGTLIIPTYRLFNEFNETSVRSVYKLLKYILKRCLQYVFGLIPSGLFATATALPAIILVILALTITLKGKELVIDLKINKLQNSNSNLEQVDDYRRIKEINHLKYIKLFPGQVLHEMGHRSLLRDELVEHKDRNYKQDIEHKRYNTETHNKLTEIKNAIAAEKQKSVINQTRVEGLIDAKQRLERQSKQMLKTQSTEMELTTVDIEFTNKKLKQLPWVFYLSGLFVVIVCSFIFTFIFAYFGNFFYKSYLFRNDETIATWREFVIEEKQFDSKQPLLSTTLNFILLIVAALIIVRYFYFDFFSSLYH